MKNIFDEWLHLVNLNSIERDILINCKRDDAAACNNTNFNDRIVNLKERLGGIDSNFKHNLCLSQCATNLIEGLFNALYDDKTIVISTMQEHVNVLNILKDKNVHYVDFEVNTYSEIINDCCNIPDIVNKKIIIYISGTQVKTGTTIPNIFFYNLIENLHSIKCNNIITILDDVQGMFILNRDYSIFDYIIGNTHSLISNYNIGILWYKSDKKIKNLGCQNNKWIDDYFPLLNILSKRMPYIIDFNIMMKNYFKDYLLNYNYRTYKNQSFHMFSFDTNKLPLNKKVYDALSKYKINVNYIGDSMLPKTSIGFRAQEVILYGNIINEGIEKMKMILDQYEFIRKEFRSN